MGQGSIPAVIAASMRNVYPSVKPRTQKTSEMSVPENPVSAAAKSSNPVGMQGKSNCRKIRDSGVSGRGRCACSVAETVSADTYGRRIKAVAHPANAKTNDQNNQLMADTRLMRGCASECRLWGIAIHTGVSSREERDG